MNRLCVTGCGAVSPAGWTAGALADAVFTGAELPWTEVARPPRKRALRQRAVPAPAGRPAWLAHPRLRRASVISHYTVSAALEALGPRAAEIAGGGFRLGVIVTVMSGSVTYSRRFFDEVLRAPGTASPVLFPETVYNAPASHLAAVLGADGANYTLVGDASAFVEALVLVSSWLAGGEWDGVLVVGAEEPDWLTAEAWQLFDRGVLAVGGSGALLLEADGNTGPIGVELRAITDRHTYDGRAGRGEALARVRKELAEAMGPARNESLLVDGTLGAGRTDAAEASVWAEWPGQRCSPLRVLGDGLAASSAWQCVTAVEALRRARARECRVSVPGINLGAAGIGFSFAPRPGPE